MRQNYCYFIGMNRLLRWIICLSLLTQTAWGQIININYGSEGIERERWRYKPGDNVRWADSAYSDKSWKVIPSIDNIELKDELLQIDRGWFRQVIQAKPKAVKKSYQLVVKQFGTSEVYLDGRRLATLKPVTFDSGGSQRLVQLVPITLADTHRHVLAVRYRLRPDPTLRVSSDLDLLNIHINSDEQAADILFNGERWSTLLNACSMGIFAILALLHFLFYRANRSKIINRTLGWAMFLFALNFALEGLYDYIGSLTYISIADITADICNHAGFFLLLTAVYQYLNVRYTWIYYSIAGAIVLDQGYRLITGSIEDVFSGIPFILFIIDYIRISFKGKRTKDDDARLPWNSLKVAFFCFLSMLVFTGVGVGMDEAFNIDLSYVVAVDITLMVIILFSIPVGLSLSLVRDYTRTHETLRHKLQEVEALSAQTLAQEQEKQLLLAKQNEVLEEQVQTRTAELNASLEELKTTQAQLIQREKLASLGELTAGIAHEIQNPLNFVNNFAEVSVELVQEIQEERTRPGNERDEGLETEILDDLEQNVQKIAEHGKRAASIVRGMLQHSRASTGKKQDTDLNALIDESLRLAYHGFRAINKTFNATLETNFAPDVPLLKLVPEDMGRVMVNLFNNAFYAVQQRSTQQTGYTPTVSVSTKAENGQATITIRDNGTGIPDEVINRIFQPFFTTKPTGEGTGLGLSLSYDIVTKGHSGSFAVNTQPGEFTEFVISLPLIK